MRPLTAIALIIPGCCFAIMVSLIAVIIVVRVLGDEYPRLQHEFDPLLTSLLIFAGMTVISAASFDSLLKNHAARYWGQVRMWVGTAYRWVLLAAISRTRAFARHVCAVGAFDLAARCGGYPATLRD